MPSPSPSSSRRHALRGLVLVGAAAAFVPALGAGVAQAAPVVTTAAGADAAAIQPSVDAFRAALGTNNAGGPAAAGGRREINWDGVGAGNSAPNAFPAGGFLARGALFTTPGTGFAVSGAAPLRFGEIDASYETEFQTFSPQKLFTATGSTVSDTHFFVPGTGREATSDGFGVVLTDADRAGSAQVTYFDDRGQELANVAAPASPDHGLSFVGVRFPDGERVARVRIRAGTAALASGVVDSDATDVVAMDDFIYGEPIAGRLDVADPSITVGPDGATVAVTVRRGGDASAPASVRVRTQDGTAKAGEDYDAIDQRVDFAANETVKTVTVTVRHATIAAPGEAFSVVLSEPSGIALGTAATATVSLLPAVAAPPVVAPDRQAPVVSLTRLTQRVKIGGTAKVVLGSSEAGSARLRLYRGGKAIGAAKTVTTRAGATVASIRTPRYGKVGTLVLRVVASDAAGNQVARTISIKVVR